jgi:hypothetical protein
MQQQTRGGTIVASTYLTPSEIDELRRRAQLADRSIAAEMRRVLRSHYFTSNAAVGSGGVATTEPSRAHAEV